jgi:murein DD-endopeptidase MepM/ murein hydrolase activator NlpD
MGVPTRCTLAALLLCAPAAAQDVAKRVGALLFTADRSYAFPGGLLQVRMQGRSAPGGYAILNGRRAPFFASRRGPRALLPIPADAPSGRSTVGIELFVRRGRQRIPLELEIDPRAYERGQRGLPAQRRDLLRQATSVRDSRRLLAALRTLTQAQLWSGGLRAPVDAVGEGFGAPSPEPEARAEQLSDAIHGEYHRGLDYEVPSGSVVQAPAAGSVVLAEALGVTGQTLVIDHGQGVVSALFHLGRIDVRAGERVEARAPLALSGDTGLAASPHVHWGVYLHGVAVDPRALAQLD